MTTRYVSRVTTRGPFFQGDPAKTFRQNAHELMKAVAREGTEDVAGQLRLSDAERKPISGTTQHVSDYVTGELRKAPPGPNYRAVTFVMNRGLSPRAAVALMAAASRVESMTHAFRKSRGRMTRARAINSAELLKGLQ